MNTLVPAFGLPQVRCRRRVARLRFAAAVTCAQLVELMQSGMITPAQHDVMRDLITIQDPVLLSALERKEDGDDRPVKGTGSADAKVQTNSTTTSYRRAATYTIS